MGTRAELWTGWGRRQEVLGACGQGGSAKRPFEFPIRRCETGKCKSETCPTLPSISTFMLAGLPGSYTACNRCPKRLYSSSLSLYLALSSQEKKVYGPQNRCSYPL